MLNNLNFTTKEFVDLNMKLKDSRYYNLEDLIRGEILGLDPLITTVDYTSAVVKLCTIPCGEEFAIEQLLPANYKDEGEIFKKIYCARLKESIDNFLDIHIEEVQKGDIALYRRCMDSDKKEDA